MQLKMGSNLFCLLVSYNQCSIPYFCILRFPGQIWSPLYWPQTTSEVEMLMRKGLFSRPKSALWRLLCILTNTRVVFFVLGIAGLEPATIRLKAQCSTNWAIHPILQEGLVRKRKEGGLAPFLLIISQGRGSVWYSTVEQVWESFPLIEDSI